MGDQENQFTKLMEAELEWRGIYTKQAERVREVNHFP